MTAITRLVFTVAPALAAALAAAPARGQSDVLPPPAMLAQGIRAHLLTRASDLVGQSARLRLGAGGVRSFEIRSLSEGGIAVAREGMTFTIAWDRLGHEGLYELAARLIERGDGDVLAYQLLLGIHLGKARDESFVTNLARLKRADAAMAECVAAAVPAAPAPEAAPARSTYPARREAKGAAAEVEGSSGGRVPYVDIPEEEFTVLGSTLPVPDGKRAALPSGATVARFENAETAGMSGFRADWDKPQPKALVFDAVHRSLLIRFPGCAARIAKQLNDGKRIERVEIVLPFEKVEYFGEGYRRPSFQATHVKTAWAAAPRWHAVAWLLRKPWRADASGGPTFNAFQNGRGWWVKYGAQDLEHDRFAHTFGPAEVSLQVKEGRLDLTEALSANEYGDTPGRRLRAFEEHGVLVRKWETYDARYWLNQGGGAASGYEWATATGGRGIHIGSPRLEVAFVGGASPRVELKAPDRGEGGDGPTAVMPSSAEVARYVKRLGFGRRAWMPDWQWQRVQELKKLGGGRAFPTTEKGYVEWIDRVLSESPRLWGGWDVSARMQECTLYAEAMPDPVLDHYRLYWWAWLMPFRPNKGLVQGYVGRSKAEAYYKKTRDWRGNFSVYRTYCRNMGTMNFNHTFAGGTLIGGALVGSDLLLREGRHGVETFPLRTWSWYDGSTQESIDHYYFAITLGSQKVFADMGPTHFDRMMGVMCLAKSIEEIASAYHPGLRHMIASSGRTNVPANHLVEQDGLQHILHTLSPEGALHDIDNEDRGGMRAIGHDLRPGQVADQMLNGPWAPVWVANVVDRKPLPYQMTNTYKEWGHHRARPLWRRTYLGHHYGLASTDVHIGSVHAMAQWRRAPRKVDRIQEIGTMFIRYGANDTNFVQTGGGQVPHYAVPAALHHENKMIVVLSPHKNPLGLSSRKDVTSLQSTVGIYNYEDPPTWKIYVDGKRVTKLPATARHGSRITIHDGVTYIGVIPLPAPDLGRDEEVVLSVGGQQSYKKTRFRTALNINSYNVKRDAPVKKIDAGALDRAYGVFVIEFGDAEEYESYEAFRTHIAGAVVKSGFDAAKNTVNVVYRSGNDVLELGCRTDYSGGTTNKLFTTRTVNGAWPYLEKGFDRDTTLSQQGTTGRLQKNGAAITCEPGTMAYLQTEPVTGTYAGFKPFSKPASFAMTAPGGARAGADGKLGTVRIILRPGENKAWVDHAFRPADRDAPGLARYIILSGFKEQPAIEYNGVVLERVGRAGGGYAVPLAPAE